MAKIKKIEIQNVIEKLKQKPKNETKSVSYRLNVDLVNKIKKIAEINDLSETELVQELLIEVLSNYEIQE